MRHLKHPILLILAVCFLTNGLPAQEPKVSRVYKVGDLVAQPQVLAKNLGWFRTSGIFPTEGTIQEQIQSLLKSLSRVDSLPDARGNPYGLHALVRAIALAVQPKAWHASQGDGSWIRAQNGNQLTIHTTKARHEEIKSFLDALRRMSDLAVVFEGEVREVTMELWKQLFPEKGSGPLPHAMGEKLLKALKKQPVVLKTGKVRFLDNQRKVFFSIEDPLFYQSRRPEPLLVVPGIRYEAHVGVSRDRRRIHIELQQQVTLAQLQKQEWLDPEEEKKKTIEVPLLQQKKQQSRLVVDDGIHFVAPIQYQPRGRKSKKPLVLLVYPWIYIKEEEELRKEQEKKKKRAGQVEAGSFQLDPKTGGIAQGQRDYFHPATDKILNAIFADWMTSPETKKEAYGYLSYTDAAGKSTIPPLKRLRIDRRYVPRSFRPSVPGIKTDLFDRSEEPLKIGELCIRVDRFLAKKNGIVEVEFVHSGPRIIGGDWVTYHVKKHKGKWVATFWSSFDP